MTREGSEGGGPPELTADECVRAGMYWFGRNDLAAAEAWWRRALYLEPAHVRAQECLRLLAKTSTQPGIIEPALSAPERPSVRPEHSTSRPEHSTSRPEHSTSRPERSSSRIDRPDPSSSRPEHSTSRPERSSSRIDRPDPSSSRIDRPDPSSSRPERPISQADRSISRPDRSISRPDRSTSYSEHSTSRPDRSISRPDRPTSYPDRPTSYPDRSTSYPDRSTSYPDRSTSYPDRPIARPERSSSRIDRPIAYPERSISSSQRLSSQDIERQLFGEEPDLWAPPAVAGSTIDDPGRSSRPVSDPAIDAAAWALGQAAKSSSTDPLEFATDIPEDTGDIIRVDDDTPDLERTPWDEGPARTSVVTLKNTHAHEDHDPIAEPTPLPDVERDNFFGRGGEFDPEMVGILEEPMSSLRDVSRVLDERSDPISVPAPHAFAEPDIRIDDPIEASNTPAHGMPALTPDQLIAQAKDLYQLHDFGGAIDLLEKLLEIAPNHVEGRAMATQSRSQLMRMLESKIGDLDRVPRLMISTEEVIWLNLNHRAGFILSQIDGAVTYDDIIALSGMPRLDTLRILVELISNRVIGAD